MSLLFVSLEQIDSRDLFHRIANDFDPLMRASVPRSVVRLHSNFSSRHSMKGNNFCLVFPMLSAQKRKRKSFRHLMVQLRLYWHSQSISAGNQTKNCLDRKSCRRWFRVLRSSFTACALEAVQNLLAFEQRKLSRQTILVFNR